MPTFSRFVGYTLKLIVIIILFSFIFMGIYRTVIKDTGQQVYSARSQAEEIAQSVKIPPNAGYVFVTTTDTLTGTTIQVKIENATIYDITGALDVFIKIHNMTNISVVFRDINGSQVTVNLTPTYVGDSYSVFNFEEYNVQVQQNKVAKKLVLNIKITKNDFGVIYINGKEVKKKYLIWVDCFIKL